MEGDAHPCVLSLDEGCVQTAGLPDLLLDQVVAETPHLEVVLHARVHRHNGLPDFHHRGSGTRVDARVQVQLVEEQHLLLHLALENPEEQALSHFAVIDVNRGLLFLRISVLSLGLGRNFLLVDYQDLVEDQGPAQRCEVF